MEDWIIGLQPRMSEIEMCLANVPQDILSLILSKLFFKDYCNFKMVCKSWNLICPVRPLLPPINLPEFHSPCLMIPHMSNCSWKIYHSLYNNSYYLEFPELMDAEVLYSKYGWLLMSKDEFMLFFFNPFTRKKIELPPTTKSFFSICFTSPPTDSNCIIFGFLYPEPYNHLDFTFIKVGDGEWKSKLVIIDSDLVISNCPPVFLNGVYYFLECKFRNIIAFDLTKEEYEFILIEYDNSSEGSTCAEEADEDDNCSEGITCAEEADEDDNCSEESTSVNEEEEQDRAGDEEEEGEEEFEAPPVIHESYMLEVDGDICWVFVTGNERRVSIHKLDLSELHWIKLKSLRDKCLYVSINGSFAETSDVSGITNKIYFNKFHDKSGIMYSLTSGMYYSIEGGFASKDAYGLTEVDYGVWLKPTLDQM
ncbi:hypothetical protein CDL12_03588 [Handroanthus impetiginosus]|uniref:F-box domain-containing protein n=1 Tax=Handroanthus impetiginosus TaxID=429701 RepID=A0A2G9I1Q1_9LAMI|nr:hypothetical protein CDL12_03588 [Handroanthus impetiginosus]